MLVIIIYLLLFIGLIFIQKNRQFQSLFKVSKKVSWLISGFSLFMLQLSLVQRQFLSGIIAQYGMKGLWLLVTFLTPNQSDTVYLKMMPIIESRKRFVKRFVLALLFGALLTGVVSLIWWKILF